MFPPPVHWFETDFVVVDMRHKDLEQSRYYFPFFLSFMYVLETNCAGNIFEHILGYM